MDKTCTVEPQSRSAEKANASSASRPAFPCQEISRWKKQACNADIRQRRASWSTTGRACCNCYSTEGRGAQRQYYLCRLMVAAHGRGVASEACLASTEGWSLEGGRTALPSTTRSTLRRCVVPNPVGALLCQTADCVRVQSCHRVSTLLPHDCSIQNARVQGKYARNKLNKRDGRFTSFSFFLLALQRPFPVGVTTRSPPLCVAMETCVCCAAGAAE